MYIYVLVGQAGHYQGVYISRQQAERDAEDKGLIGFTIYQELV